MKKALILLSVAIILPAIGLAQVNVVDTLVSTKDGTKYVRYENNIVAPIGEDGNVIRPSRQQNVRQEWNENSLGAYHVTLADIPDELTMDFDSLGLFTCPYEGSLSSHYGYRNGRRHTGTDIPLSTGDPVLAAFGGTVRVSMFNSGYGNLVVIRHPNGLETYYAHLSERKVEEGDVVNSGDVIGLGGSTGRSTGPHLHFEARYMGFPFDAERIIDFPSGELREHQFAFKKSYLGANSRYGVPDTPARSTEGMTSTNPVKSNPSKVSTPSKPKHVYHTVKSGDNLSKIANKYHTTVSQICKLNKIDSKKPIRSGQKLRVK